MAEYWAVEGAVDEGDIVCRMIFRQGESISRGFDYRG